MEDKKRTFLKVGYVSRIKYSMFIAVQCMLVSRWKFEIDKMYALPTVTEVNDHMKANVSHTSCRYRNRTVPSKHSFHNPQNV